MVGVQEAFSSEEKKEIVTYTFLLKEGADVDEVNVELVKADTVQVLTDGETITSEDIKSTIIYSYEKASDINGDGAVTLADLSVALAYYQTKEERCDINLDGVVDTLDYIIGSYDGFYTANIMYYERSGVLYGLAAAFLLLVVLYGRKKGAAAVSALVFTLINVVFFFIPMLINGVPAILAAIIIVLVSTLYSMVVLNGFCSKSYIATICCVSCTALAGLLAWAVGRFGGITTLNTPEVEDLLFITENTKFRIDNLLTAGILIAAMGAVMDTSMSIVSSLHEIKEQNPGITAKQLYISGMNIGKDIMGTMTNTLILAFAGSSMNLIVIYYMYCMPVISLVNSDFMLVEAVKGLIGSLAVVISIPMAAIMTAAIIGKKE